MRAQCVSVCPCTFLCGRRSRGPDVQTDLPQTLRQKKHVKASSLATVARARTSTRNLAARRGRWTPEGAVGGLRSQLAGAFNCKLPTPGLTSKMQRLETWKVRHETLTHATNRADSESHGSWLSLALAYHIHLMLLASHSTQGWHCRLRVLLLTSVAHKYYSQVFCTFHNTAQHSDTAQHDTQETTHTHTHPCAPSGPLIDSATP